MLNLKQQVVGSNCSSGTTLPQTGFTQSTVVAGQRTADAQEDPRSGPTTNTRPTANTDGPSQVATTTLRTIPALTPMSRSTEV